MMISAFLDALGADGPAADRAGKMDLYGRFVGSWDLDVMQIAEDGTKRRRKGEWHFGWALEGRAIQDVWIVPPRGKLRSGNAAANVNSYGTTLRVYDPGTDAWLIQWTDPVTQNFLQMIGRADGSDIVQLGTRPDGNSSAGASRRSAKTRSFGVARSRRTRARAGNSMSSSRPGASQRDLSHRTAGHPCNDDRQDSAGRAAGTGARFDPQRVRITLRQDSTPSTTIEDAASAKKFCAVAPCVDRYQPPVAMNASRAVCASTGPSTLAAPCDEKYIDIASPMKAYIGAAVERY